MNTPVKSARGFSLIEVLVTWVLIATGVLGMAKMQATALSSTQTARVRSLIALQAGSLAAAMRANRAYWAAGLAPARFTAAGTQVSDPGGVLSATVACTASPCTPAQLAADDVQHWIGALNAQFPSYTAAVNCAAAAGTPVSCDIHLSWNEKQVAIQRSGAASAAAQTSVQQYTLHVLP
jgi:type IV pilus assembly protein PilV